MDKLQTYFLIAFTMLFCMVNVQYVYTQTYLGEDEIISVESSLSIAGNHTIINSSIRGKGKLVFVGNADQKLMTKPYISLPEIDIQTKYSFTFKSPVFINGNLNVNALRLIVQKELNINGSLFLADECKIQGKEWIIENLDFHNKNKSYPLPNNYISYLKINVTHPTENSNTDKHVLTYGSNLFFDKDQHYKSVFININIPPPKPSYLFSL